MENEKKLYKKVCLECGASFESSYPITKYCSPECAAKHSPKPQIKSVEKKCPTCGTTFETVHSRKKFCSPFCRAKRPKPTKDLILQSIICTGCNKRFIPSSRMTKYCSPECRKSYNLRKAGRPE